MIQVKFKNLEKSEMARELTEELENGLSFDEQRIGNSPSQPY